jgi:thiaminase
MAVSPCRTQRIERPFRRTPRLERGFFDAAYDG